MSKQVKIDEPMERLVKAVDVAVWAYSVNKQRRRGTKKIADFDGAMDDLIKAYDHLELQKYEVVLSQKIEG